MITALYRHRMMFVAVVLFFGALAQLRTQTPTPCTPDCPETPFLTTTYIVNVSAPPPWQSCIMAVKYVKRKACGIWNDIQVLSITFPGAACQGLQNWLNDPNVSSASKALLMGQAHNIASLGVISTEFLNMYNNATPSEQQALECPGGSSIWRASKGSCWFIDSDCWHTEMKPCPNSACCLHEFSLCMNQGVIEYTLTSTIVPSTPCGNPENPGRCAYYGEDGKCYFQCDNDGLEEVINKIKSGDIDMGLANQVSPESTTSQQ